LAAAAAEAAESGPKSQQLQHCQAQPAAAASLSPDLSGLSTAAAAAAANFSVKRLDRIGCPEQRRSPAAAFADIAGLVDSLLLLLDCDHFACHACLRTSMRLCISEGLPATCLSCNNRLAPGRCVDSIVDEERPPAEVRAVHPAPRGWAALTVAGARRRLQIRGHRHWLRQLSPTRVPGLPHPVLLPLQDEWHPSTTCEQARPIERQTAEVLAAARAGADILSLSSRSDCNHMRCKMCGSEFCWLCRKEITDLHYLSPSGCTFWGKKPWSRKKKILWQLGTLIGRSHWYSTAGRLAVPAITMGVPVLVAVLSVGVSVPILLAYVYGVVPVSLCRANGCGILQDEDPEDDDEDMELHGTADADQGLSFSSRSGSRPVVDLMAGIAEAAPAGTHPPAGSTSGAVAPAASVERDLASGCSQADAQTEESISLGAGVLRRAKPKLPPPVPPPPCRRSARRDGKSISIISEDRQPIELPTAQAQAHNQLANCDAAAGETAMATVAMDASDSACRRCSLSAASAGYARDQDQVGRWLR
uniref:RING-type domain-containing protein n=1 Tax=Macrostomum lignano TaxID=282301 RepID=A0A1I8FFR9_9PLAT